MELWDIYDEFGRPTGRTHRRGEPLPPGDYHLVSCVLVRHTDGDFLLLRRSPEKEVWPNIWEIGAGGCVRAGETAEACARRELWEETGITAGALQPLDRMILPDGPAIYVGFQCITDHPKDQIRLQPRETCGYRWLTKEQFLDFMASDDCIERFKVRLKEYVKTLVPPSQEDDIDHTSANSGIG